MTLNPSEIILTAINFLLLLFVLNQFLFKPYFKFMDARDERIKKAEEAAVQTQEQLRENGVRILNAQAKAKADAEAESERLRAELAEKSRRALEEYNAGLEKARQQSLDDLSRKEKSLDGSLETKVPELSAELLSGLLGASAKKGSV